MKAHFHETPAHYKLLPGDGDGTLAHLIETLDHYYILPDDVQDTDFANESIVRESLRMVPGRFRFRALLSNGVLVIKIRYVLDEGAVPTHHWQIHPHFSLHYDLSPLFQLLNL